MSRFPAEFHDGINLLGEVRPQRKGWAVSLREAIEAALVMSVGVGALLTAALVILAPG